MYGWKGKQILNAALKDLYQNAIKQSNNGARDIARAHDAAILRQYVSLKALDDKSATEAAVNQALNTIHPRTLVRIHTLSHNNGDASWIHRMADYRRHQQEHNALLAKEICNPNSSTQQLYVKNVNFLDASDPVLQLLNRMRANQRVTADDVSAALDEQRNRSIYAKSLVKTVVEITTMSA
uniref:hypothetical protein n=1 Tax=Ningiella ruwaisensis TaxID=2364274 RepID=UPI0010A0ADFC|nr:hypothetical protein [Ningiella ruwaisensis]